MTPKSKTLVTPKSKKKVEPKPKSETSDSESEVEVKGKRKKMPVKKANVGRKKAKVEESTSESEEEEVKKKVPVKGRKKSMKDEFKMDIRDMIVKKRIASLNASAIMSASYAQERAMTSPKSSDEADVKPAPKVTPKAAPKAAAKSAKSPEEGKHILVEIEDEKIKSQLIASALKKTSGAKAHFGVDMDNKKANEGQTSKKTAEPKKVEVKKKKKKRKIKPINVVSSSSSESSEESEDDEVEEVEISDDEEEIEEITTEGARRTIQQEAKGSSNPVALRSEMNKVDVQIVDGGTGTGMYQVVHRFETIQTTTAVVKRNREGQQVRSLTNS